MGRHDCDPAWAGGARFGHRGFRPPFHGHIHGGFGGPWGGGPRARRGDVRAAVLRLLAEGPMHGYQIIQELTERSGGAWRPSAGSVYPTLQLLEDEGLVSSQESGGKRVYSLTEAGAAKVAESAGDAAPWEGVAADGSGYGDVRQGLGGLIAAVGLVTRSGSEDQRTRALEILTEARKKIYAILAED